MLNEYEIEQLKDEQLLAITAHRGLIARYGSAPGKEMLYTHPLHERLLMPVFNRARLYNIYARINIVRNIYIVTAFLSTTETKGVTRE